ncbi:MAG: hypothetical protein J0I70_06800 [Microbacterium sp.]|uniref:hypothetical protein n=1 Tax=Microbacterium sp. TaxID=51671 RepID=UPI000929D4A5|nr:hypothetical protein [Microbacterium sp.]MBN9173847.1 hypothetical protein [Microbacterium sp.]MBN9189204.1 hypothetical protein [Microbacterium sp.]MBN9193848.1 hypothetical protein [Microbacterium sp.]OJU70074.1 MAG: hypothetical protein BGO04_05135 [Microbacterium sp. 70-38]
MKTTRYANNYRFPPAFIQRWTRICVWTLIAGVVVAAGAGAGGIALSDAADRNGDDSLSFLAFLVLLVAALGGVAVLFAFVTSAFLGGEAIARGAGWIGIGLIAGLLCVAVGAAVSPVVFGIGIGLSVLATIGFFIVGIRNRVPIWFGRDR